MMQKTTDRLCMFLPTKEPCHRILLTEPRLVLMDESTSALDTDNEAFLYGALQEAGIRYVSIGHRPTLADFHSKVLRLSTSKEASEGGAASDAVKCKWEVYSSRKERSQLAQTTA